MLFRSNNEKLQLRGGDEVGMNCFWCICVGCTGEWVTKAYLQEDAEAGGLKYCEYFEALCAQVDMENCWGIAGDQ